MGLQLQEALLKLENEENGAGDGLIDFGEFQRLVVKSKAKQLFSSLDTDGSNTVKRSEFRKKVNEDPDIAKMISYKGTGEEELIQRLTELDQNKDEQYTMKEL